jgi:hypothetical protein
MITEWEAGGNVFAVNGQIWGVNGRGKANAWGFSVPSLDDVGTPFGYVSTRPVLVSVLWKAEDLYCADPPDQHLGDGVDNDDKTRRTQHEGRRLYSV